MMNLDSTNPQSYMGEPATNKIINAGAMTGWGAYNLRGGSGFLTQFGTTGYSMVNKESWNGIMKTFNLVNSGTYTFSAKFRYRTGTPANNGATVYISNYSGGGDDTAVTINKNIVGDRQYVSKTVNVTTPSAVNFYLISYGGNMNSGTDFSTWDVTMPQIEMNTHRTPFVDGTRTATQGRLDLAGYNTLDISNMSFDANAQMYFNGVNNYITISSGVIDETFSGTRNWTIAQRVNYAGTNSYYPQFNKGTFLA